MKKTEIKFDDFLTLDQLAEKAGVSLDILDRWRKKGMPVIKLDKYLRVYWPKFLEWLVKQEERTETGSPQSNLWPKNDRG